MGDILSTRFESIELGMSSVPRVYSLGLSGFELRVIGLSVPSISRGISSLRSQNSGQSEVYPKDICARNLIPSLHSNTFPISV